MFKRLEKLISERHYKNDVTFCELVRLAKSMSKKITELEKRIKELEEKKNEQ